jgi:hypothetical protein
MSEEQPNDEGVRDLLRKMGVQPDNPLQALNMDSYAPEDVVRLDAPAPEALLEEEDQGLRRTAGPPFDRGEEGPYTSPKDPWTREVPELGTVSVTEEEQCSFWRALWHDEVWQTTVAIEKDGFEPLRYTFRTRSQGLKELVALAADRVAEQHPIKTIHNTKLVDDYYLRLCIITQLLEIDGKTQNAPDAVLAEGERMEDSQWPDKLAAMARVWFNNWSESRIKMAFRALHVFEIKLKILEDASINRTF